jgi:site-specific DNA recombinase
MRAAIYGRVSSSKQIDNFSIPSQIGLMRAYCDAVGGEIIEELPEQGSAFLEGLTRSKLKRALELARTGQIDTLVFFSPDRFTRDMADGVILRRELYRLGVKLICYHPTPREITSDMEVLHILTDWQSQQYVEKMREASMRGTREKVQSGLFPQGRGPYGYHVVGTRQTSRLEVIEELAEIIKLMFTWYVHEQVSTIEIARRLTAMAAPTSTMLYHQYTKIRKRPVDEWTSGMVYWLLTNEAYTGVWYAFRERRVAKTRIVNRPREDWVPITIPAIVDRSLWEAAQQQLKARGHIRRQKYQYLVGRRVRCICGKAAHGCGNIRREGLIDLYYECRSRDCADGSCGAPMYRADDVDAEVWKWLCDLISNPTRVLADYRAAQATLNQRHAILHTQLEGVTSQIAEHNERLSSLVEARAIARAEAAKQALDQRIEELGQLTDNLTRKRDDIRARLEQEALTDAAVTEALDEVTAVKEELDDITQTNDFVTKRRLIEALNIKVTLYVKGDRERWVDIHWCLKAYPVRCDRTGAPRHRRGGPPAAGPRAA